jgi:hypothetical protein
MRGNILKKGLIVSIVILLTSTSVIPVFSGSSTQPTKNQTATSTAPLTAEKTASITFYVFEKTRLVKQTITLSTQDAVQINAQFQELKIELAAHRYDVQTQRIVQQFINLLTEKHALPTGISAQDLSAFLKPPKTFTQRFNKGILPLQGQSSEWFCNFATTGTGAAFPIIILPRFIPFILIPIPRIFVMWSTPEGITSVGGLISHTGFIAVGQQKGIALGFWGIGFSIFLPPIDQYGIIGYALFARVTADYMEPWPPNNPPEITQTDPADGQTMVPLSTSELRFSIYDADTKDRMSYEVTTNPDIGSGSGGLKPNGVYSISISGLESLTNYTWHITLTDGKDTTQKTMKFTTEPVGPIITNPNPSNGEKEVSKDITQLQFRLKNYQGLAMDFTVQTSPNIGSDQKTGVHDGTYTIPVTGLTYGTAYRWFINATDGIYWTRKVFTFETGYPSQFDPFAFGWHYRKQVTIDHTKVADDLTDFPVFISTVDSDLMKARNNGGDFLFMNNVGVASKLYHDLDFFDQTTGEMVAWVKIPQLSSQMDTVIYLYYGNPLSVNMSYPKKVWGDKYEAVYHLSDSPMKAVQDSSGNTNNGVTQGSMTSSDLIQGKLGTCYSFDGSDDFISFNDFTKSLNQGSCSAWVQTTADGPEIVWGEGSSSSGKPYIQLGKLQNGELYYGRDVYGTDSNYQGHQEVGMNDGTWHYIVWSSSGSANHFFFDGQEVMLDWQDGQNPSGIWFNDQTTDTTSLGVLDRPISDPRWDGLLDEIHITNVPLSQSWIGTEFENQNNPTGFCSFGPEVPGP